MTNVASTQRELCVRVGITGSWRGPPPDSTQPEAKTTVVRSGTGATTAALEPSSDKLSEAS